MQKTYKLTQCLSSKKLPKVTLEAINALKKALSENSNMYPNSYNQKFKSETDKFLHYQQKEKEIISDFISKYYTLSEDLLNSKVIPFGNSFGCSQLYYYNTIKLNSFNKTSVNDLVNVAKAMDFSILPLEFAIDLKSIYTQMGMTDYTLYHKMSEFIHFAKNELSIPLHYYILCPSKFYSVEKEVLFDKPKDKLICNETERSLITSKLDIALKNKMLEIMKESEQKLEESKRLASLPKKIEQPVINQYYGCFNRVDEKKPVFRGTVEKKDFFEESRQRLEQHEYAVKFKRQWGICPYSDGEDPIVFTVLGEPIDFDVSSSKWENDKNRVAVILGCFGKEYTKEELDTYGLVIKK